MAYIHTFLWLAANKRDRLPAAKIHVVTDCEYLVKAAKGECSQDGHRELWAIVNAIRSRGAVLRWHWVRRDTIDLNRFAHELANLSRVLIKGASLAADSLNNLGLTNIADVTPGPDIAQDEPGGQDSE